MLNDSRRAAVALLRARADFVEAMQKRDLDAADTAMDRIARLRTDAAFARLEAGKDARDVLTADQRTKLEQVQAMRRARMGAFLRQRRGGAPGMRFGPGARPGRMGMPGAGAPSTGMPGTGMSSMPMPAGRPMSVPPDSL